MGKRGGGVGGGGEGGRDLREKKKDLKTNLALDSTITRGADSRSLHPVHHLAR